MKSVCPTSMDNPRGHCRRICRVEQLCHIEAALERGTGEQVLSTTEPMAATPTELQRSSGTARLSFRKRGKKTVLDTLYQEGCSKVRFPREEARQSAEAILINTSGGLTDGDSLSCTTTWGAETSALITTQAAERIYKSRDKAALVRSRLHIGEHATARWLPQETILFDESRLDRTTDVSMSGSASLFAVESTVFGRAGMGEVIRSGRLFDRWRIRIDGTLVFADAVLFDDARDGPLAQHLARMSVANGASAIATIVYAGADCAAMLDSFREALAASGTVAGASNLGPLIVARVLAENGQRLRDTVVRVFEATARGEKSESGGPCLELPRVWSC